MTDENKKDQNVIDQDEIVTVEPGQETQTVEEEIQAITPEAKEETKAEEKVTEEKPEEEENKEEEDDKRETDTASLEEPSVQEEPKEEDKKEDASDDTPSDDEVDKAKEDQPEDAKPVDDHAEEIARLHELEAELAEMKDAEETRRMVEERENVIKDASTQLNDFTAKLSNAVLDTFQQYGIDPNTDIEELKKDPAKFQIAKDIVMNAQRIQAEKQAELMKGVTEISNKIIFKEASKMMAAFDLTEDQTKVCAETLINIFDATGLADLKDDLKAKVELAVARAKMIAPKVVEVVEDVKDAVKDVAKAPEVKEEDVQKVLEKKVEEKPEVKEEKPSIEAFKEGATAEANVSAPVESVTAENVLEILKRLPHKEKAAFFLAHQDKINQAMTEAHKKLGR